MAQQKIQKHIEIVRSDISNLSSMGKKSCDALFDLLNQHYTNVGVTMVSTVADLESLVLKQPDLVFMGMKYVPGAQPGTKVWVSEYLTKHLINHTGSPKEAIELEQNKPLAKQRVDAADVQTAQYQVIPYGDTFTANAAELSFPMFVKPAGLGAGQGVDENSVVHTTEELNTKVDSLMSTFGGDVLVETYLAGREYSVAVLRDEHSDSLTAMPLELVAGANQHGQRILSYALKSAPLETPVFPVMDEQVSEALKDLAIQAFDALGARDYGRIDIRMDEKGMPHFLEANLIPCIIQGSGNFPKACAMNIGMGYEAMILHIVRLALARSDAINDELDSADVLYPTAASIPA